ncbi:MAG: TIR domain-containing protein [Syntrophomonadaceae bacterium]|nr:TIR domain-containing protein [Syntrophomonadaceae bacterium]
MARAGRAFFSLDPGNPLDTYLVLAAWTYAAGLGVHCWNPLGAEEMPVGGEREARRVLRQELRGCRLAVALVGRETGRRSTVARWEMETALELDLPVLAVNLNGKDGLDQRRCPEVLKGRTVLHVAFARPVVTYALQVWPERYPQARRVGRVDLGVHELG